MRRKCGAIRGTYNTRCIGPAVVESVIKRRLGCSKMRNNRVSSTVGTKRKGRQEMVTGGTGKETHKRVTMPRRRRTIHPRLVNPRSVNIDPESLSTSRRGSGRWRSSSGSGLSTFQLAGSADNEN